MSAYERDRLWSDRFIPQIKRIVGPLLLVESSDFTDCREAADLVMLLARNMTIAARVRRPGYAERYPYEFTIRSRRDSGAKTELEKLLDGWGDWMFYGHADKTSVIWRWWIIDLHVWRNRIATVGGWSNLAIEKDNTDGATHFVAFDVRTLWSGIIGASHRTTQPPQRELAISATSNATSEPDNG